MTFPRAVATIRMENPFFMPTLLAIIGIISRTSVSAIIQLPIKIPPNSPIRYKSHLPIESFTGYKVITVPNKVPPTTQSSYSKIRSAVCVILAYLGMIFNSISKATRPPALIAPPDKPMIPNKMCFHIIFYPFPRLRSSITAASTSSS